MFLSSATFETSCTCTIRLFILIRSLYFENNDAEEILTQNSNFLFFTYLIPTSSQKELKLLNNKM